MNALGIYVANPVNQYYLYNSDCNLKKSKKTKLNSVNENVSKVFCPPPPGKPNPNEALIPGIKRSRVIQSEQKMNTCGFYAFQMLRDENKIGKKPNANQLIERDKEKILSDARKKFTDIEKKYECLRCLAAIFVQDGYDFKSILYKTKSAVEEFVKSTQDILELSDYKFEYVNTIINAIEDFKKSKYNNLNDFVSSEYSSVEMQEKLELNLNTLNKFNYNIKDLNNVLAELYQSSWEKASTEIKYAATSVKMVSVYENSYGVLKSTWNPNQPIENLVEQIRMYGPHWVLGDYLASNYVNPPNMLSEKIEGRSIYAWKPNTLRLPLKDAHSVVVVGADANTGRVYYQDPNDGSSPGRLETQKIYALSYEKFKTRAVDVYGRLLVGDTSSAVYAFHMPKK